VRLIVADTSPVNYLVMIGHIEILPQLFEKVFMPAAVRNELADLEAPSVVREWISTPPAWLEVRSVSVSDAEDVTLQHLDDGEQAAIRLAVSLGADLLLMDEREGAAVARRKGLVVTGTIGVLDLAARRGLVDLKKAFDRLKRTSFRYPREIMEDLLRQSQQTEPDK
jgi:predicted nucleic acid-binding protein